jgi:choice-of-anchor C domain-containing protein
MKRWILLFALLVVAGAPAATAQPGPNIVVNGDFEVTTPTCPSPNPPGYWIAPPAQIAGWIVEDETVDIVCTTAWPPASGQQSLDLTGTPGQGTIRQDLPTEPGETYLLRFAMGGNFYCEEPVKQMRVEWGDQIVATLSFDTSNSSPTNMGWMYHQFTVQATGTPTPLRFISLTGTFCGPALDDVSVRQLDDGDDDDGDDGGGDDDGDDCVEAPSGLVSWWPGDGHYRDIADGNDATPFGGTGFAPGKVREAFTFDGATGAVRAPETDADLDGFSELTLDAWIRPNRVSTAGSLQGIVTKYDSRSADGVSYYLTEADSGKLRLAVFDTVVPEAFAFYTSDNPVVTASAPSQFTHVAGVWDGGFSQNNFHLYVNGTEVPGTLTLVDAPADMANNDTPVNIGRFESSSFSVVEPFGHFQGEIDEVEIFNRALSEAEIDSIVNAGSAGKCKPGEDDDDFDDDEERDDEDGDDDNDGREDDDDGDDDNDGRDDDDDGDDDNDGIEDEFDSESADERQFSNTDTVGAGQENAYDLSAGANTLLLTATAEVAGATDVLDNGLTVEIYDPRGVLVANSPAALGRVVATAVPVLGGAYKVKVRNTGSAARQYRTLRIARTTPLS